MPATKLPVMEKRLQRIRQTPKHMEKMLFVNHKEEQSLQRRLEAISSSGRIRGRELDRERIKVRNEWRYHSRLNYMHVAPQLEQIPTLLKRDIPRPTDTIDPVNVYLLREYRRNSQVIPSILSALGNDSDSATTDNNNNNNNNNSNNSSNNNKTEQGRSRFRRATKVKRHFSDEDDAYSDDENMDDTDQPDPSKVTSLVREITKIRSEMLANKKIDLMRSRVTFRDLIRDVREKEKQGSESDTYTDGTCALLRRKMNKMRLADNPDLGVEVIYDTGQGIFKLKLAVPAVNRKRHSVSQTVFHSPKLPALPVVRSSSSIPTVGRHHGLGDSETDMKKKLEEQERYQTEIKVAREIEKYRNVQRKIGEFLEKNKRKAVYPLLFDEKNNT